MELHGFPWVPHGHKKNKGENTMKTIKLPVNQELVNYVERLSYEEASYKDVILTLLDAHKGDTDGSAIDNPVFKSYQEKYASIKAEYEMAKNEVTNQYVPDCLAGHQYDWNLDFSTNELTITVRCDCGVAALEEYLCAKN